MSLLDWESDTPVPYQYSTVGFTVWGAVIFAPPELVVRVRLLTVIVTRLKLPVSVMAAFVITDDGFAVPE